MFAIILAVVAIWFASWGIVVPSSRSGSLTVRGLQAPATIARDARGVPHVRAASLDDAYFAQGYATAQDRLFQLDLLRRFVAGELAEVFGPAAADRDVRSRLIRPRTLARGMYEHSAPAARRAIDAYTAGVNAAIAYEPLPVEFRVLLYRPKPWTGEDTLLAGLATVVDLTHSWNDILVRERINRVLGPRGADELIPLSDPAYDAPLVGRVPPRACKPPLRAEHATTTPFDSLPDPAGLRAPTEASNNWAIGAAHTADGHALVANDPHLDYSVPGVWHLIEIEAPGLHVAGATFPGIPGVVLGHNDRLAWGTTNATVSTVTVYRERLDAVRTVGSEQVAVRFGRARHIVHEATNHGFVFFKDATAAYAAEWVNARDQRSPLDTFLALDAAAGIDAALKILASYIGPPQNFVLGDIDGRVGYHMAGAIPNDGVWSTRAVDGAAVLEAWHGYVPFAQLPHIDPSREQIVWSANNRVAAAADPYRLTDYFAPGFRAMRIADALRARKQFTLEDMRRLQLDNTSPAEREFAHGLARFGRAAGNQSASRLRTVMAMQAWDGAMSPDSPVAAAAFELRSRAVDRFARRLLGDELGVAWRRTVGEPAATAALLCALRSHAVSYEAVLVADDFEHLPTAPWRDAGLTHVYHPLHAFGISLFDPPPLPGDGDYAAIKVQGRRHGQSFRAVWSAGAWNAGGIVIPFGESGRPRTAHFADQAADYIAGRLVPLSFDRQAPSTLESLELRP